MFPGILVPDKEAELSDRSDRSLVHAAQRGDMDSFGELCSRYYPAMVAIAHSILGDRHMAEDAAQDALAKTCRRLQSLKQPDRVGAWLASICRNRVLDMVRGSCKERFTDGLDQVAGSISRPPDVEAVRDAITNLSATDKEVIYLRYYNALSYRRMAAVLEISTEAINGRLRRARSAVAGYLKQTGDFGGES